MRTLHLGISVADQFQEVLINEKYNKNSNKKEIETSPHCRKMPSTSLN